MTTSPYLYITTMYSYWRTSPSLNKLYNIQLQYFRAKFFYKGSGIRLQPLRCCKSNAADCACGISECSFPVMPDSSDCRYAIPILGLTLRERLLYRVVQLNHLGVYHKCDRLCSWLTFITPVNTGREHSRLKLTPVFTVDVFDTRGHVEKSIAWQCFFQHRPWTWAVLKRLSTLPVFTPLNTGSVDRCPCSRAVNTSSVYWA